MAKGGKRDGAGSKPQGEAPMVKTGFSMPPELAKIFAEMVPRGSRSQFIAKAVLGKLMVRAHLEGLDEEVTTRLADMYTIDKS